MRMTYFKKRIPVLVSVLAVAGLMLGRSEEHTSELQSH